MQAHEVYDLKNANRQVTKISTGTYALLNPQPSNVTQSVTFTGYNYKQKTYQPLQSFSAIKLTPKLYQFDPATNLISAYSGLVEPYYYKNNPLVPTIPFVKQMKEITLPIITKDNITDLINEINASITNWWSNIRSTVFNGFHVRLYDPATPGTFWQSAVWIGSVWSMHTCDAGTFPTKPAFIDTSQVVKHESIVCHDGTAGSQFLIIFEIDMLESISGQVLFDVLNGSSTFYESNGSGNNLEDFSYPTLLTVSTNYLFITGLFNWWVENYKYSVNSDEKPKYVIYCGDSKGRSKIIFTEPTSINTDINKISVDTAKNDVVIYIRDESGNLVDPSDIVKLLMMNIFVTWEYQR